MPKHSNLPEKIISLLNMKPAIKREEISTELKVSYQSVQKHLLKMQQDQIVSPAFVVIKKDIKQYMFWIFITTKNPIESGDELENKQNDEMGSDYQRRLCRDIERSFLKESDLVTGLNFGESHIVIGGVYDIILQVFASSPDSVGRYVTRFLRSHPAIVSTSTAWSLTESMNDTPTSSPERDSKSKKTSAAKSKKGSPAGK